MGSGDARDTADEPDIFAENEPVSANDFARLRVPDDHLSAGNGQHGVEFVDIAVETCSASGVTERDFAESADFAHSDGSVESVYHVYFVVALVGSAEETVGGKFGFNQGRVYFGDYVFHIVRH